MKVIKVLAIAAIVASFLIAICLYNFKISLAHTNTPEAAIRRHLLQIDTIQGLTCTIEKSDFIDEYYGQQYTIKGFPGSPETGGGIFFAYVNKDSLGMYYWTGGGSGP